MGKNSCKTTTRKTKKDMEHGTKMGLGRIGSDYFRIVTGGGFHIIGFEISGPTTTANIYVIIIIIISENIFFSRYSIAE
jgi:hypothetical protein